MKFGKSRIAFLLLFSFLISNCFSQDIMLENSTSSKKISKSNYVEIVIKKIYPSGEENCCEMTILKGNIQSVIGDSILINVSNLRIHNIKDDLSKEMQFHWEDDNKLKTISQNDIQHLIYYKSTKGTKIRAAKGISGLILVCGAIVSMINTLITGNKGNRQKALTLGGIEIGAGLIIAISSTKKKYKFRDTVEPWELHQVK